MSNDQIFYVSIVSSLLVFGLLARWYVMPCLRLLPRDRALLLLVLCHAFRYVGLGFLVPGVVASDLPPAFARPAAYGDLVAAVLAVLAAVTLRAGFRSALWLVWLFNVVGTIDFLYAFFQGYTNAIGPGQLGSMYFVPTLAVPALMVTHVMIFWLLVASAQPTRGAT